MFPLFRSGCPYTEESKENSDSSILKRYYQSDEDLIVLSNCLPYYSALKKSYVLNFGSRVKKSSIKNFQINGLNSESEAIEPDEASMEFGRITKDEFCLNAQQPFSIISAFMVSLTAFDY